VGGGAAARARADPQQLAGRRRRAARRALRPRPAARGVIVAPLRDDGWLGWWGTPLTRFNEDWVRDGHGGITRLVLYDDGTKVDHQVWTVDFFREQVARPRLPALLDAGYRVLLDKDGIANGLPPATRTAHIPARPTEAEYLRCVHEFWWETCYVAKNIWRDELFQMKYSFDAVIKFQELRLMLEWHAEIDHGWSARPGAYGRGLRKLLRPDVWAEVEATFVGPGTEENWQALFRTGALFRRVAVEVAEHLGYAYPHEMDAGMVAYWERVRALPRGG
jgi:aminoglycoside 6-adenylyltransferase